MTSSGRQRWRSTLGQVAVLVAVAIVVTCTWTGMSDAQVHSWHAPRFVGEAPPLPTGATAIVPPAGDGDERIDVTLTLRRRDEAGFRRFVDELTREGSPTYRQFLSQPELASRFGPTPASYDAVRDWLVDQGFEITQDSDNRLTISGRAPRRVAAEAFGTPIDAYDSSGRTVHVNTRPPALPADIAENVMNISGLSDQGRPQRPASLDAKGAPGLCHVPSFTAGGDFASGGLLASAWLLYLVAATPWVWPLALIWAFFVVGLSYHGGATAYCSWPDWDGWKLIPGWPSAGPPAPPASAPDGAHGGFGQKIGLLEFDSFDPESIATWVRATGGDSTILDRLTSQAVNGGPGAPGPDQDEVLLDINTVMALASDPSTSYAVYEGSSTTSFQAMFNAMINDGVDVISNSWSTCESQVTAGEALSIDSVLAQAAASGISVFNGSGDSGSTCLDGSPNTVGVPADSPHATAVGGTTWSPGPANSHGVQTWWDGSDDSPPHGGQGGFGVSRYFARPAYQDGRSTAAGRSVPDVATVADPANGMQLCHGNEPCPTGPRHGGTSMSAPEMAAVMANLNRSVGHNLGEANAVLYPLDVSAGFQSPATMGSDFAHVGLGAPQPDYLLAALLGDTPGVPVAASPAFGSFFGAADGSTPSLVRADLVDADGYPVSGKSVTVTPSAGSHAVITPIVNPSSTTGTVAFEVRDSTVEDLTLTLTDSTDGVPLTMTVPLHFLPPPATAGSIAADLSSVPADGTSTATVTVTLQNGMNQPAAGKQVTLAQGSGHAIVQPQGATPGVTDGSGVATFKVSNSTEEAVTFSAVDVSDGNLPIPGTASIGFTTGTGSNRCPAPPITVGAGYATSTFATGFPNQPVPMLATCSGVFNGSFDSRGNFWVSDIVTGDIYRFGPDGGTAAAPYRVTTTGHGAWLIELQWASNGKLYGLQTFKGGACCEGAIYEINPADGAYARTVADHITGYTTMNIDPLSGDLFIGNGFNGFLADNDLLRIHDPGSGQATVDCSAAGPHCSVYASPGGVDSLRFEPSGTLYAGGAGTTGFAKTMWSITGTNAPSPGTATVIDSHHGGGVVVVEPSGPGRATVLLAQNRDTKGTDLLDLATNPPTVTSLLSESTSGGAVGPDGCLYVDFINSTLKVTAADGSCPFPIPSGSPETITLTQSATTAPTGSSITWTAQLHNVANPAGRPINFAVTGANGQAVQVLAGPDGRAQFVQQGVHDGLDQVTAADATTLLGDQPVFSTPEWATWTEGPHVSFLALDPAPSSSSTSTTVTVGAHLTDLADDPESAVAGLQVSFDLAGSTCSATTDAAGHASCAVTAPATAGTYTLAATFAGGGGHLAAADQGSFRTTAPPRRPGYHPLTPTRILETRPSFGSLQYDTPWGGGTDRNVHVVGGAVPAGATAVALNVTAINPSSASHLTVYPRGAARPVASSLNFVSGVTVPNLVIASVGSNGDVQIFNNQGTVDLAADVVGWFDDGTAGGDLHAPTAPARILETRPAYGSKQFDTPWAPGGDRVVHVTGGAVPDNATAVVLNVTAIEPSRRTHLTVYPDGQTRPNASNVNVGILVTRPNLVIAQVGSNGNVRIFNNDGFVDIAADVVGYFRPAASGGAFYNPRSPVRVLESRPAFGSLQYDTPWGAGTDRTVQITGGSNVPANATAVVVNVTAINPTRASHLTVYTDGQARPDASNLNFSAGVTIPNLVIVGLSDLGRIRIYNNGGNVDIAADVVGYFTP